MDFLGGVDVARWQEGVPWFGFVGAFCFGFGGWRRWQFGIEYKLAHRFVCGARRGRLALEKEVGYDIRFIPATQGKWKRTAAPGSVLVLSVSF